MLHGSSDVENREKRRSFVLVGRVLVRGDGSGVPKNVEYGSDNNQCRSHEMIRDDIYRLVGRNEGID